MANLKEKNRVYVAALISIPLLVSFYFQFGFEFTKEHLIIGSEIGISFILSCIFVLFSSLLPQDIKHKIVFLRIKNELPACRCHKLLDADARIDINKVKKKWPKLFQDILPESERNKIWYNEVYKPVRNKKTVESAHQEFLMFRDSLSGVLITLTFGSLLLVYSHINQDFYRIHPAFIYTHVISIIFLMLCARIAAKRMVVNAFVEACD
ncbi:hypothetical protein EHZ47_13005 [Aeromonas jandaei]|uniref:hypothetical protein n=1 Tax=Aeromonas jandaei TaxID=650 RepID=UPI000F53ACA8|nr:hypothetical protein [Aeromonas jandaei]RQM74279.1 hypothetical protein EHZ47_13005 [Aeromonas jandaei]